MTAGNQAYLAMILDQYNAYAKQLKTIFQLVKIEEGYALNFEKKEMHQLTCHINERFSLDGQKEEYVLLINLEPPNSGSDSTPWKFNSGLDEKPDETIKADIDKEFFFFSKGDGYDWKLF